MLLDDENTFCDFDMYLYNAVERLLSCTMDKFIPFQPDSYPHRPLLLPSLPRNRSIGLLDSPELSDILFNLSHSPGEVRHTPLGVQ